MLRRAVDRRRPWRGAARVAGAAVGVALAVAVAGCASGGSGSGGGSGAAAKASAGASASAGPRNDVDLAFADTMIPHGVQALASTQLAAQRATTPQLKQLANTINATQVPQIETLSALLTAWGQPVPTVPPGDEGVAITPADLARLAGASGKAFDQMWLTSMIHHQQIALAVAQTEVKKGSNPQVKAMAQKILEERQAQVTTMQGLLTTK